MKRIVAILKKKTLKANWGFIFDTDIQMYVESFMLKIHVGSNDYTLSFEDDAPQGVYTEVKTLPIENGEGELIDVKFIF